VLLFFAKAKQMWMNLLHTKQLVSRMHMRENDEIIPFYILIGHRGSLVSLIAVSLVATILGPYKAHRAFAATMDVSIPKGASNDPTNGFDPKEINVKVGDTVKWTNNDNALHTVTSGKDSSDPNKGKDFDSGLTPPNALTTTGKTFQHTFTTAGTFPYFCQVHPGMAGTVIVK
jgi:plastocyanin